MGARSPERVIVTTFCNQAHLPDGRPVGHACFVLPPAALELEDSEDYAGANDILAGAALRPHRGTIRKENPHGIP